MLKNEHLINIFNNFIVTAKNFYDKIYPPNIVDSIKKKKKK